MIVLHSSFTNKGLFYITNIFMSFFLIIIGFILLLSGACFLVDGAKNLALKYNVKPLVIAVTIIAFGTSSPELFVSLISAINGKGDMALGNVIGSNIANIALVLAIACIIKPIKITNNLKFVDLPVMIIFAFLLFVFSFNGFISRSEGLVLLVGLATYFVYCIKSGKEKNESNEPKPPKNKVYYLIVTIIGLIGIIFGARFLVNGGVELAKNFGLSETFIAISVFAIGSSLPELATSIVASFKKEHDISIGNVIGSNIQNVAIVIGVVALIKPMSCNFEELNVSFFVMLSYSILLYVILLITGKLNRIVGFIFLAFYAIYIFSQI